MATRVAHFGLSARAAGLIDSPNRKLVKFAAGCIIVSYVPET